MMDTDSDDQGEYDSTDEEEEDDHDDHDEEEDYEDLNLPSFAEYKELGNGAYKRKDYREAIQYYTVAVEAAEHDEEVTPNMLAAVYSNRAAAHQMLLLYDKALEDCNFSIEADSKFLKAHWRKAKVLVTLGRYEEAIKAYSIGLVHDPNDAKALQEKADVKKLQQRYELAQSLVDKNVNAPSVNKRDARQAVAQLDIILAQSPNWYEAQLLQLQAKVQSGGAKNLDSAYALSTKLLRKSAENDNGSKSNAPLLLARAQCLFYQGAMDDAMNHLKQILSGDPDNKRAFAMVKLIRALKKQKESADAAYKARDYEKAVELYTETLSECPRDNESLRAKLHFNRAACHNALRQHEDCVKDCTAALEIQPDYTKALMRRAASNLLIGGKTECESAIRDYETALQTAPESEQSDLKKKIRAAKIQLKRASKKDLYKILGVSRDATEGEIKKAFRKLALKLHPDRLTNCSDEEKEAAEAKFREVNLAHEILSDPQKKQRYDQGVDEQDIDDPNARPGGHHGGGGHGFGGMDQQMLFEMFMRQQQGGRGGGRRSGGGGFPGGFHFG